MAVWRAISEGFRVEQRDGMWWTQVDQISGGGAEQTRVAEARLNDWEQKRPGETFRLVRTNQWELDRGIREAKDGEAKPQPED